MSLSIVGYTTGLTRTEDPVLGGTINVPEGTAVGDLVVTVINFGPDHATVYASTAGTWYFLDPDQGGFLDSTICFGFTYEGTDRFISWGDGSGPRDIASEGADFAVVSTVVIHSDIYPGRALLYPVFEGFASGATAPYLEDNSAVIQDELHIYGIGLAALTSGALDTPDNTSSSGTNVASNEDDVFYYASLAVEEQGPDEMATRTWGGPSGANDVHTWGFRVVEIVPDDHSDDRPIDVRAVASGVEYLVYTDPDNLEVNKYDWTTGETTTLSGGWYSSLTDVTLFYSTEFAYACDFVGQKIYQINSAANASPVTTEIFDFSPLYRNPYRVDACTGTSPNELYILDCDFSDIDPAIDPPVTSLTKLSFDGSSWIPQQLTTITHKFPVDLAITPDGVAWILVEDTTGPYLYRWEAGSPIVQITLLQSTPSASGSNPRRVTAKADGSAYVTFGSVDYSGGGEV